MEHTDSINLRERMNTLPPEVQGFLYGTGVIDAVHKVGAAYKLHIDQEGALEADVMNVMIGLIEPSEFPKVIADHLDIDLDKAAALARDLDADLFQRIRTAMQNPPREPAQPQPVLSRSIPTPLPPPQAQPPRKEYAPGQGPMPAPTLPVETYPELESGRAAHIVSGPAATQRPQEPAPAQPVAPAPLIRPTVSSTKTIEVGVTPGVPRATPTPSAYATDPYREPLS